MPPAPIERPAGFTRCYGCGGDNRRGLALEFFRDGDSVVATFVPADDHGGYGRLLHGGVTATLVDEAFGWTLFGLLGKIGITTTMKIDFSGRLLCGAPITIRGTVLRRGERHAEMHAILVDADGKTAATGTGTMRFVSQRAIERLGGFEA